MTIPEASQLVLQAGGQAENGNVYVLNMGDLTKIVDLATDHLKEELYPYLELSPHCYKR